MQIANPIYDVVFKYLMQNNEIAILILSTILERQITALDLLLRKVIVTPGNRFFTVCFSCSQAPAWERNPRNLQLPNHARPSWSLGARKKISERKNGELRAFFRKF